MVKKDYKLVEDVSSRLRPGRHPCQCQARVHALVRNCLSCGRIVCQQEGSGPCFFCGNLVCTREERELLEKKDQKSLDLLRKLLANPALNNFDILEQNVSANNPSSLTTIAEGIDSANAYKQKLLFADKDQQITKVNDLQADYFSLELNPYLTDSEREAIVKRKEELRQLSLQTKRNFLVDVDLATGAIEEQAKKEPIETVNDPVLQSILVNSTARHMYDKTNLREMDGSQKTGENAIDCYDPVYVEEASRSDCKPAEMFASIRRELGEEGMSLLKKKGDKLNCIGLAQPMSTKLAKSAIDSIPWPDYIDYRGPILIAALDQDATTSTNEKPGTSSSDPVDEYPQRAIIGRAFLRECLTREEFACEMHPDDTNAPSFSATREDAEFVLIFDNQELLSIPIPYVCPSTFFPLDRAMLRAINSTLLSGAGILDTCADVPVVLG